MMEALGGFLVQRPLHILGVAAVLGVLWVGIKPRARSMLMAALAWAGYAVWEWAVLVQTPEADIRVDLLVLWPLLAILTVWALIKLGLALAMRRKNHEEC